jgi:uncharacterized damage-inducible protein DinB
LYTPLPRPDDTAATDLNAKALLMDAVTVIHRLHRHRVWVNEKLLASAAQLDDGQLRVAHPIGQGSVWNTLLHLYAAEYVWLEALLGSDDPLTPGDLPGRLPGNQQGEGSVTSLEELAGRWAELRGRWDRYLASLTPESLDEPVYKVSTSSGRGRRFRTRRLDVLLHLCTHAQYTVAQAVNMLRRAGAGELPDVMLISMAREEAQGPTG